MASTSQNSPDEIEEFFGCYLLISRNENPRIYGRTYIGFTVDPNRRIRQHNAGKKSGGAWRTSKRGPWDMILLVHGFPNQISALRFEWAWQHPNESRRLKSLRLKKRTKEKQVDFRIRVLDHMLRSSPWTRLSLAVRWSKEEYTTEFPTDLTPPENVRVTCGAVKAKKRTVVEVSDVLSICQLCKESVSKMDRVCCLQASCSTPFHLFCLAQEFLKNEPRQLLPLNGQCPVCSSSMVWTNVVRPINYLINDSCN